MINYIYIPRNFGPAWRFDTRAFSASSAWNPVFVWYVVNPLVIVNDRVWSALTTNFEQMDGDQKV